VEASSTPTICRLSDSRRHQLWAIAPSRLSEGGQQFEYRMTIKSINRKNAETLSSYLRGRPEVIEFRITPTGD
jgi:hypothetical protein